MATWNSDTQFGPTPTVAGLLQESGYFDCTASEVDGADLSIPTKLSRIKGGIGITSDGLVCLPTCAVVSNGTAVFKRCGASNDETPTLYYILFGV